MYHTSRSREAERRSDVPAFSFLAFLGLLATPYPRSRGARGGECIGGVLVDPRNRIGEQRRVSRSEVTGMGSSYFVIDLLH